MKEGDRVSVYISQPVPWRYSVCHWDMSVLEGTALMANKLDIMLGGGRASFLPWSRKPQIVVNKTDAPGFDYEDENDIWDNYRDDDRDLLAEWENNSSHGKRKYIDTKELLLADDLTDNDQVMGEHMSLRNCSSCEQKL